MTVFIQLILIATLVAAYVWALWCLRALFDKLDEPEDIHGVNGYKDLKKGGRKK